MIGWLLKIWRNIKNIRMRIVITENKIKNVIYKFLDKKVDELIPYESVNDYHPNEVFFIDPKSGRIMFSFNKRDGKYYVDSQDMFSDLLRIFSKSYGEAHDILKDYFIDKFGYGDFSDISTAIMPSQSKYVWRRVSDEFKSLQEN